MSQVKETLNVSLLNSLLVLMLASFLLCATPTSAPPVPTFFRLNYGGDLKILVLTVKLHHFQVGQNLILRRAFWPSSYIS